MKKPCPGETGGCVHSVSCSAGARGWDRQETRAASAPGPAPSLPVDTAKPLSPRPLPHAGSSRVGPQTLGLFSTERQRRRGARQGWLQARSPLLPQHLRGVTPDPPAPGTPPCPGPAPCRRLAKPHAAESVAAGPSPAAGSVQDLLQVVLLAELAGEGQAGEVLHPAPVHGADVEPDHQRGEEPHEDQQGDDDHGSLAVLVYRAEGDVGQEGEGEEEAAEEAEEVSDVIDPRQEATDEEEEDDAEEVEEGFPGFLQHLPALEELHKEAGQQAELGPGRAHLRGQGKSWPDPVHVTPDTSPCPQGRSRPLATRVRLRQPSEGGTPRVRGPGRQPWHGRKRRGARQQRFCRAGAFSDSAARQQPPGPPSHSPHPVRGIRALGVISFKAGTGFAARLAICPPGDPARAPTRGDTGPMRHVRTPHVGQRHPPPHREGTSLPHPPQQNLPGAESSVLTAAAPSPNLRCEWGGEGVLWCPGSWLGWG